AEPHLTAVVGTAVGLLRPGLREGEGAAGGAGTAGDGDRPVSDRTGDVVPEGLAQAPAERSGPDTIAPARARGGAGRRRRGRPVTAPTGPGAPTGGAGAALRRRRRGPAAA